MTGDATTAGRSRRRAIGWGAGCGKLDALRGASVGWTLGLALVLPLLLAGRAAGTVHAKGFTGTLTCFQNCTPASAETAFLEGVSFTGTYSYDDAVVPMSGDASTFEDYNTGIGVSLNLGSGLYTLTVTNGGLEIARNHYGGGRKDDVYLFNMPSVFGGTGMASFPAVVPSGPFASYVKFSNSAGANVLTGTTFAGWPQTVAAWSGGFAGVEFYIQDAAFNTVGFHGAFTTLADVVVPTLSTNATTSAPLGSSISDTATLTGGASPTGTMIFNVYGPNDPTCANPAAFTTTGPVSGGAATGTVTPVAAGVYRWVASYPGDGANATVAGACNDPNETSTVTAAAPTIASNATPHGVAPLGTALSDVATLAGGASPTGNVVFRLFGPTDPTCAGPAAFTSAPVAVSGAGAYPSGSFTPAVAGTYSWVATYGGDANNASATEACGQPLATVVLSQPVVAVPALGSAGLAILVLALAGAGLWRRRLGSER